MDTDFGTIIRNYQNGDSVAAEQLYHRFSRLVTKLSYCRNVSVDSEELENALWCRFYEVTQKFDPADAVRYPAYIKSCLTQYRLEYLRNESKKQKREGIDVDSVEETTYECTHDSLEEAEWLRLEKSLELTERQKQIVTLLRWGYSCGEVRYFLGITQQGMYKHKKAIRLKIESHPEVYKFLSESRL